MSIGNRSSVILIEGYHALICPDYNRLRSYILPFQPPFHLQYFLQIIIEMEQLPPPYAEFSGSTEEPPPPSYEEICERPPAMGKENFALCKRHPHLYNIIAIFTFCQVILVSGRGHHSRSEYYRKQSWERRCFTRETCSVLSSDLSMLSRCQTSGQYG